MLVNNCNTFSTIIWNDKNLPLRSSGKPNNTKGRGFNYFLFHQYLDDMNVELSGDLSSILDAEKMNSQTSQKLRDFFHKLIQTDVQIKKLKQDINNYYQNDNLNSFTERFKRSLKNRYNNHHYRTKKRIKKNVKRNVMKNRRRSLRNNSNITGYIIEEEKVVVQYEPGRKRNFPKCSHSHETKSHEKKLKHPFYKHSQRIDEMLKYKKPELSTNVLVQEENEPQTLKPKTSKMILIDYKLYDDKHEAYTKKAELTKNVKTDNESSFDLDFFLSTTPVSDVALSASTFVNPLEDGLSSETTHFSANNRIGYRKLMVADEEYDEEPYYDDLKRGVAGDHQEQEDLDRQDEHVDPNHFQSQILNPNWKGPMPFYPDELNAMIKQAALQNMNIQLPVYSKDMKSDRDKIKKDVSDTEYIEDYADKKFNKMVKMAQAYSDYGVVYNKKNEDNKDKINQNDNRFRQSLETRFNKNRFFGSTPSGPPSEGIRFEYKPGNIKNEHDELISDITKHIKFVKHPMPQYQSTKLRPISSEYENVYSTSHINIPISNVDSSKSQNAQKKKAFDLHKCSRSLKSIDITDESYENPNISTIFNLTNEKNSNIEDVFSFLASLGDWFRTLANLSDESHIKPFNITQVNSTKSENRRAATNNSSDLLYPSYDLDMVDNIGHRSRVLMSVENNTDEKFHTKPDSHIDAENSSQSDSDNIIPIALILAANTPNKSEENKTSKKANRTSIVKRSIDDSKLVFWNGLYDDNEYGIKLDFADKIRDKHLANNRNVMQKSKDWIQGKFKNMSRKVKEKKTKTASKKNIVKSKTKVHSHIAPYKLKKRNIQNSNETPELSMKKSFATLNANMKKVCQEAAKAVQNTKNIGVRDDNKEGAAATALMQQLVRLMTDLVDIQVQQKTCAKLPSDLQSFLEWLTSPAETNIHVDDLTPGIKDYVAVDDGFVRLDKSTKADFATTLSEGSHLDDRTECLGTIRAVQDLIQQYDGMNDDDKSKMSGVKDYLENQLSFLNKKLHSLDDMNLYKLYDKRELPRNKRDSKDKPKKFIKNFCKKHTKTTQNDYITKDHDDKIILNNNYAKDNYNINTDLEVKVINNKDEIKRS